MRFTRKLILKRSTNNDHNNKSWRWFYVIGYIIIKHIQHTTIYTNTRHTNSEMPGSSTTKHIRLNSHQMSILPRTKSPVSDCTKLTPNLLHKSSWGGTNSPIHRFTAWSLWFQLTADHLLLAPVTPQEQRWENISELCYQSKDK